MTALTVCIGFVVGFAVAATGIGGGILLTPLLTVVLRIPPMAAIGTALSFMSATKLVAVVLHWSQKTVDLRLVGQLTLGSLPGAILGAYVLAFVHARYGENLNSLLRPTIAVTLILIALLSVGLERHRPSQRASGNEGIKAIGIGFAGGVLVSATSVGSGSLIILLLLIFCPRAPVVLVGTDILHALILTTVAALLYLRMNIIDLHLVGLLLCGSVPGIIIGTRVSVTLAAAWLRTCLLILAMMAGVVMFWR